MWMIAEIRITRDGQRQKYSVNYSYELTPDWIFIYDCIGGSGTGYKRGDIIQKLYVGDCEVLTYECIELTDKTIQETLMT